MNNADFVTLLTANANKTKNVRIYNDDWKGCTADRAPDSFTNKIGKVVALLQAKVQEGIICKPDQCLLLYNFQVVFKHQDHNYYSLEMVIKPISDVGNTKNKIGIPFQVCIDEKTGEVMNLAKVLVEVSELEADLSQAELSKQCLDYPRSYGNYNLYKALCSFVAIANYRNLRIRDIFEGAYDFSSDFKQARVYDSYTEAIEYLKNKGDAILKIIEELPYPKEDFPTIQAKGFSKEAVKIIDISHDKVEETHVRAVQIKEANIDDELDRLAVSMKQIS